MDSIAGQVSGFEERGIEFVDAAYLLEFGRECGVIPEFQCAGVVTPQRKRSAHQPGNPVSHALSKHCIDHAAANQP